MKEKRIKAHEMMPVRGYLEQWEFADIINQVFDDIGTCKKCINYETGHCYAKITREESSEDETSWEDLEKYFVVEEDFYCGDYRKRDTDEEIQVV